MEIETTEVDNRIQSVLDNPHSCLGRESTGRSSQPAFLCYLMSFDRVYSGVREGGGGLGIHTHTHRHSAEKYLKHD